MELLVNGGRSVLHIRAYPGNKKEQTSVKPDRTENSYDTKIIKEYAPTPGYREQDARRAT